jgi:hypothetical protein
VHRLSNVSDLSIEAQGRGSSKIWCDGLRRFYS